MTRVFFDATDVSNLTSSHFLRQAVEIAIPKCESQDVLKFFE